MLPELWAVCAQNSNSGDQAHKSQVNGAQRSSCSIISALIIAGSIMPNALADILFVCGKAVAASWDLNCRLVTVVWEGAFAGSRRISALRAMQLASAQ